MAYAPQVKELDASTNNATVSLGDGSPNLASALCVQFVGGWSGTLTCEGTLENVTWYALLMTPTNGDAGSATVSTNKIVRVDATGLSNIRMRVSTPDTGTVEIYVRPVEG